MNRQLRIAIADDDAVSRDFLCRILSALDHEVICAAKDGRQLADECHRLRPDLVITDVNMPRLDGISAAAEITREHDIPIILMSGNELPTEIESLRHVSVLMKCTKPISRADLRAVVDEIIKLSESLGATT